MQGHCYYYFSDSNEFHRIVRSPNKLGGQTSTFWHIISHIGPNATQVDTTCFIFSQKMLLAMASCDTTSDIPRVPPLHNWSSKLSCPKTAAMVFIMARRSTETATPEQRMYTASRGYNDISRMLNFGHDGSCCEEPLRPGIRSISNTTMLSPRGIAHRFTRRRTWPNRFSSLSRTGKSRWKFCPMSTARKISPPAVLCYCINGERNWL